MVSRSTVVKLKVDWCPPHTDYTEAPKAGDVYFHLQILALVLTFSLSDFVRGLLCRYQMASSQLMAGGWCIFLDFQALCNTFVPDACKVEDFSALYMMRTKEGGRFFIAWSSLEKLIVNLADNNHGGVIPSSGSLEFGRRCAEGPWSCSNCMEQKAAPAQWHHSHGRVQERVQRLLQIGIDYCN